MDLQEMAAMLRIAQSCDERELQLLTPDFKRQLKHELKDIPLDQWELCVPVLLRRFLPEQST